MCLFRAFREGRVAGIRHPVGQFKPKTWNQMAAEDRPFDQLVTLPQILAGILDGIHREGLDARAIADVVGRDPATAARVLDAAHGAGSPAGPPACPTLEDAVASLGIEAVRTLVVTAAFRQFLEPIDPSEYRASQDAWWRSMATAQLAYVVATLTRFRDPDQAMLCGLLLDAGRFHSTARKRTPQDAVHTGGDTAEFEIGAAWVETWCADPFMADAVRYQDAAIEAVRDAHQLVKVVRLARLLAQAPEPSARTLEAAEILFGLEEGLTRELSHRVNADIDHIARSFGVGGMEREVAETMQRAQGELGRRLGRMIHLTQVRAELARADSASALYQAVRGAARLLLDSKRNVLFLVDADRESASAWLDDGEHPAFVLPLVPGRSLVADAALTREPQRGEGISVVDRQIAGLLGAPALWCLPLAADAREGHDCMGILALGIPDASADASPRLEDLARLFAEEAGKALAAGARAAHDQDPDSDTDTMLEQVLVDVSTPLTVIGSQVEMLRVRLADDASAQRDLALIRDETARVGEILARLRPRSRKMSLADVSTLNDAIEQVAETLAASHLESRGIRLTMDLDPAGPRLEMGSEMLRQILGQLLRNMSEALEAGGGIRVATRGDVNVNGRAYVQLEISDDGLGLTREARERLFAFVAARGEKRHRREGLATVQDLMDEKGGIIVSSSDRMGTRIQLLFPKSRIRAAPQRGPA
ncbi:MAG: HDOD domain-containing protein [Thioalkalivibrio sp.]|nr:MAG: HDOD domain-containing protein [Thioalkalivibrio sp.]